MTTDQADQRARTLDARGRRVAARAALDARRSLETAHRLLRGGAHVLTGDEWREVGAVAMHAASRIEQLRQLAAAAEREAAS